MPSGYKIHWSDRALADLKDIIDYLEAKWTSREIKNFAIKLERRLKLIEGNPKLFPLTGKRKNVRRSVLTKHTVIYYQTTDGAVLIVTLFDPRQDPKKLNV